jgi:hypothetical protein
MCSSWNKHKVYFDCTSHHFWKNYPRGLTMSEIVDRCADEVGKDKEQKRCWVICTAD